MEKARWWWTDGEIVLSSSLSSSFKCEFNMNGPKIICSNYTSNFWFTKLVFLHLKNVTFFFAFMIPHLRSNISFSIKWTRVKWQFSMFLRIPLQVASNFFGNVHISNKHESWLLSPSIFEWSQKWDFRPAIEKKKKKVHDVPPRGTWLLVQWLWLKL